MGGGHRRVQCGVVGGGGWVSGVREWIGGHMLYGVVSGGQRPGGLVDMGVWSVCVQSSQHQHHLHSTRTTSDIPCCPVDGSAKETFLHVLCRGRFCKTATLDFCPAARLLNVTWLQTAIRHVLVDCVNGGVGLCWVL